jgi:hypothetical protein
MSPSCRCLFVHQENEGKEEYVLRPCLRVVSCALDTGCANALNPRDGINKATIEKKGYL